MARLLLNLSGALFIALLLAATFGLIMMIFAFDQVRPIICGGILSETKLDCIREWQPLAAASFGFLIGGAALLGLSLLVFENRAQRRVLEQQTTENRIQREAMREQFRAATWDVRRRVDNALAKTTTGLSIRLSNLKKIYAILGENYTNFGLEKYSEPIARSAKRLSDELGNLERDLEDGQLYPIEDIADSKSNSENTGLRVQLSILKEDLAAFTSAYHVPSAREKDCEELFDNVQSRFSDVEKSMGRLIKQLKLNRTEFDEKV